MGGGQARRFFFLDRQQQTSSAKGQLLSTLVGPKLSHAGTGVKPDSAWEEWVGAVDSKGIIVPKKLLFELIDRIGYLL